MSQLCWHGGRAQPNAPFDPAVYQPALDLLWDIFGEDWLVYAGRNQAALDILQAYFLGQGPAAAEKFLSKNSVPAFRWIKRDPRQPQLA